MAPVPFVLTKPLMSPCRRYSLAWELHSQGADSGWSQGFQPLWCIRCWLLDRKKHGLLHTLCHTLPAQHSSSSAWAHSLTNSAGWSHVYRGQARNMSEWRMKSSCFFWEAATTSLGQLLFSGNAGFFQVFEFSKESKNLYFEELKDLKIYIFF